MQQGSNKDFICSINVFGTFFKTSESRTIAAIVSPIAGGEFLHVLFDDARLLPQRHGFPAVLEPNRDLSRGSIEDVDVDVCFGILHGGQQVSQFCHQMHFAIIGVLESFQGRILRIV